MSTHGELVGRDLERQRLTDLLRDSRAGHANAVLLLGPAGIGKSALLDALADQATDFDISRVVGVESEMELSYAGLQQLCSPILELRSNLSWSLRNALEQAFGLTTGPRADRFLVGMAVLELLGSAAKQKPVLWIIDDPQWIDASTVQTVGFVCRRLPPERFTIAIAARNSLHGDDLAGVEEMRISGLSRDESRQLLPAVDAPSDPAVRERIIAEAHGNPLALLELPLMWTAAEMANESHDPQRGAHAGGLEAAFARRLKKLPHGTQTLLTLAAAEPTGDPSILWAAVRVLGLDETAAAPALASGLIEIGESVQFRHPLVRAVAYKVAPLTVRLDAHRVLAQVTDPIVDADRRAWHRACSTVTYDDEIAEELEQSASRAKARGGFLGAAALLERAAILTPHGQRRAERTLAAAEAKHDAGALDSALRLLAALDLEPPDERRDALALRLRGRVAHDRGRGRDAAELLRDAASQLETIDRALATDTHFESLVAAIWASGPEGPGLIRKSAEAARAAPSRNGLAHTASLLVDAIATGATAGHYAAVPAMSRALKAAREESSRPATLNGPSWPVVSVTAGILAIEAWDIETGLLLAEQRAAAARQSGAPIELQFALQMLVNYLSLTGDLARATGLLEEERQLSIATRMRVPGRDEAFAAALRGESEEALVLIHSMRERSSLDGQGRMVALSDYMSAFHHNALGQHEQALGCAKRVLDWGIIGYGTLVAPELAEAASRQRDVVALAEVSTWVRARAEATPTIWARGVLALVDALAADRSEEADRLYQNSVTLLAQTPLRVATARAQLLYGEWLRRCGRKADALVQLETSYGALSMLGAKSFAERAQREMFATTHRRTRSQLDDPVTELTGQELRVARLVQAGLTNREIGVRLYLSPRTVEWHLRNVFDKVGVSTRQQLRSASLGVHSPADQ